jgi:hypothetical protein
VQPEHPEKVRLVQIRFGCESAHARRVAKVGVKHFFHTTEPSRNSCTLIAARRQSVERTEDELLDVKRREALMAELPIKGESPPSNRPAQTAPRL